LSHKRCSIGSSQPLASAFEIRGSLSPWQRSPGFANLSPSSQKTYRKVLGPILAKHGHRVSFPAAGQAKPDTYLQASILRAEKAPVGISACCQ
jgi:hypothetical protein